MARGIRWEIRLFATTEVILRGSTQDIEAGTHPVTAGILPGTAYEIRAQLIKARDTAWTTWRMVVTNEVAGETVDIPAEVLERIADLEEWAGGTGQDIDAILDAIEADIARIDGLVGGVRADLTAKPLRWGTRRWTSSRLPGPMPMPGFSPKAPPARATPTRCRRGSTMACPYRVVRF